MPSSRDFPPWRRSAHRSNDGRAAIIDSAGWHRPFVSPRATGIRFMGTGTCRCWSKLWKLPGGSAPERPPQPLRLNSSRSLFNGNPDILRREDVRFLVESKRLSPSRDRLGEIFCQEKESLVKR